MPHLAPYFQPCAGTGKRTARAIGIAILLTIAETLCPLHAGEVLGPSPAGEKTDAGTPEQSGILAPMAIVAPAYKAVLTPLERKMIDLQRRLSGGLGWPAFNSSFVLTPERVPQSPRNSAFWVGVYDEERFAKKSDQGFTEAFRSTLPAYVGRDHERARMRVIVDRVPANDPFDGRVEWNVLSVEALTRMEEVPGGGATAWGEAPWGVLGLFTSPPLGQEVTEQSPPLVDGSEYSLPPRQVVKRTGSAMIGAGDHGTYTLDFVHNEPTTVGILQVRGRGAATDGFTAVLPQFRGPIDVPSWEHDRSLEARWRQPVGRRMELAATLAGTEVTGGLGTPYQRKQTSGRLAAIELSGSSTDQFAWNSLVFLKSRDATRRISAVPNARQTEIPLLEELAAPATAWGLAWTGAWRGADDTRTNIGAELGAVSGESRSRLGFSRGSFAQGFKAGATDVSAGIFVAHHQRLSAHWRGTFGLRVEHHEAANGHSEETDLASGTFLQREQAGTGRRAQISPTLGAIWSPRSRWRVAIATQASSRSPTLAERYQWFGERNALIMPNALLKPERSLGGELTVEYSPDKTHTLAGRAFAREMRDYIGTRAGAVAGVGIPLDIERRHRVNFDQATVVGTEFVFRQQLQPQLSLEGRVLLQKATLDDGGSPAGARHLEPPHVPHGVAIVGGVWRICPTLTYQAWIHWFTAEIADEENTHQIQAGAVLDGALSYIVGKDAEIFLRVQNAGNARIETDRGANGVVFQGSPRTIFGGMRLRW